MGANAKQPACPADHDGALPPADVHRDQVPSTTVLKVDFAPAKSVTSSTASTATSLPKPLQSATSAPVPADLTLERLSDDILKCIITHVLSDSCRGTPHYPPKAPHDALRLARTSVTMREAVARHLRDDHGWLEITDADTTMTGLTPAFMENVLAYYSLAAPYLTDLHLHAKLTYFPDLRSRVMEKLLDARPPLRTVDLSGFDKLAEPPAHDDLAELLARARHTISHVTLDLTPKVLQVVAGARLTAVTKLDVKHGPTSTADSFLRLLKSVHSDEHPLRELTIRSFVPLPVDLTPAKFKESAPKLKKMEYHEGGMTAGNESLVRGFIALARAYRDIESVCLNNANVDLASVRGLLDRDSHPYFEDIAFVKCNITGLAAVLAAAGNRVVRLELAQKIDAAELQAIGRCKKVTQMNLVMERNVVSGLADCIAGLPALKGLSLSVQGEGDRDRTERQVVSTLERSREAFQKFVLHGETLRFEAIRHVMRSLGPQLEYMVTGIYTPTKSRTKTIMRLLKVVAQYNPNMKVLCFGLGLTHDRWGAALNGEFLKAIGVVGEQVQGLDTFWLKRNASSILEIERPEDFVDYESDASDDEL